MTWAMYEQLGEICERLRSEPGVRVVCMRGAGHEAFVAGTDIEQFKDFRDGAGRRGVRGAHRRGHCRRRGAAHADGGGGGRAGRSAAGWPSPRRATSVSRRLRPVSGVPIARTLGNCLSMANLARLVAAFGRPRVQRMLIGAEMLTARGGAGLRLPGASGGGRRDRGRSHGAVPPAGIARTGHAGRDQGSAEPAADPELARCGRT